MKLIFYAIFILCPSIAISQDWYLKNENLIYDLITTKNNNIVTLEQPLRLAQDNEYMIIKYTQKLDIIDSLILHGPDSLFTRFETLDLLSNGSILLTGLSNDFQNNCAYHLVLITDENLKNSTQFLVPVDSMQTHHLIVTSKIHNKYIVTSNGMQSKSSLLILNENGQPIKTFEHYGVTTKFFSINDSIIVGEIPRGFFQLNINSGENKEVIYETSQRYVLSSGTDYISTDSFSFLLLTTMGLVKGVHPDYDKVDPGSDGGNVDPYSGVIYKLENVFPYKIHTCPK